MKIFLKFGLIMTCIFIDTEREKKRIDLPENTAELSPEQLSSLCYRL
jgi:hypothetical protein